MSWFLVRTEGRGVYRDQARGGWYMWFSHPFSGVVCRGHAQYSAFVPCSSEMTTGIFGLFSSYCPEFAPTAHAYSYF